jgi:hypothetical protein
MVMGLGLGGVFVGVQNAANDGVPPSQAGLAGALINASCRSARHLGWPSCRPSRPPGRMPCLARTPRARTRWRAATRALLIGACFVLAAALTAARAANTRGEPATEVTEVDISDPRRVSAD